MSEGSLSSSPGTLVSVQESQPRAQWEIPADEISLQRAAELVLSHRRLFICVPLLCVAATAAFLLLSPRRYTASASFLPQAGATARIGQLAAAAASLGVLLPNSQNGQSLDFYQELLGSHQLLGDVVDTRYTYPSDTGVVRATLVGVFRERETNAGKAREMAIRRLKTLVQVNPSAKGGTIEIRVSTEYPRLSQLIVQRTLDVLNQLNLRTRQAQASAERIFVEARLKSARDELTDAESSYKGFLKENRNFTNSPELTFEAERLQRAVNLRQQVYLGLAQSFEEARINEVRNTPVIAIIQPPELPVLPNSRWLALKSIAAFVVGSLIALIVAVGREWRRAWRTGTR